jgi:hypothetical protein
LPWEAILTCFSQTHQPAIGGLSRQRCSRAARHDFLTRHDDNPGQGADNPGQGAKENWQPTANPHAIQLTDVS